MNKVLATVAIGALMAIAVPGVAGAKGGNGVTVKGKCTASSVSKLKVKADDPRIETELEVDQNVVGAHWTVSIKDNGAVVAHAKATTSAPSGSFTVRRLIPNAAGTDTVTATAKNAATGEICSATASL
jgi:hypothetical protein